jgi:hypothetical protein
MTGQYNHAAMRDVRFQQGLDFPHAFLVNSVDRLIQNPEASLAEKKSRHRDPPALSRRQRTAGLAAERVKPDPVQRTFNVQFSISDAMCYLRSKILQ